MIAHAALMLVATAIVCAISAAIVNVPCRAIFPLVAAAAWPIWLYKREQAIFERRVVLAGLLHDASRIRRWLWKGHVSSGVQVVVAIFWATLLLGLASLLDPVQWIVLAVDAAILGLLVPRVTRWMEREARPENSGIVARRWLLVWINIGVLATSFFVIDFFVLGSADTRGRTWSEVADTAFLPVQSSAVCPAVGAFVGGLKALDALAWHAAETLIPSLPNQGLKWIAWLVFLLQAGVIAVSFSRLQLGLAALLERRGARPGSQAAPSEPRQAFLLTIALLAIVGAAMTYALRDFDQRSLSALGRHVVAWTDPCRLDPNALPELKAGLDQQLHAFRIVERDRANRSTDAAVDALFVEAESRVDGYLDWYFSVVGEYQRLGAFALGKLGQSISEELQTRVLGESFSTRLEQASGQIDQVLKVQTGEAASRLSAQVKSGVDLRPCLLGKVDLPALAGVERDVARASSAAASGSVVALAAGLLARRAATATATKIASKRAAQRGGAALAGRAAGKRAGSALAAAGVGTVACGPVCALLLGAATWVLVDKVSVEIDEFFSRDEMRAELLESLRVQKTELAAQLRALHEASIDRAVTDIDQSMQRVFVPVRQGL